MPIKEEKYQSLKNEMDRLNIFEKDLEEKFILAPKKGGQKVNKTSSSVFLLHIPTKISVRCSKDRSQDVNRFFARKMLCAKIAKQVFNEKTKNDKKLEKLKKQKSRRKRRTLKKLSE